MHAPAHRHAFVKPPSAARRPNIATWHSVELVDDYAWLKAANWQDVMRDPAVLDPEIRAYLEAENAYCEAQLAETRGLQDDLFGEMRGRLKEDDSSVPAPDGPFAYSTGFVAGGQYPLVSRRARSGGDETVLLDGNVEAEGKPYWDLGGFAAQPRSPAARLRLRRQGVGTLHHPLPRSGDGSRPARQHPGHARRLRVGQRQQDDLLRAPRRSPPAAARLSPRRRHPGRGRRPRLRRKGHRLLRGHLVHAIVEIRDHRRARPSDERGTPHRRRRAADRAARRRAAQGRPRVFGRAPRRQADHHHQLARRRGLPHRRDAGGRHRHGELAGDHSAPPGLSRARHDPLPPAHGAPGTRERPAAHRRAPPRRRRRARHRLPRGGLLARHLARLRVRHDDDCVSSTRR